MRWFWLVCFSHSRIFASQEKKLAADERGERGSKEQADSLFQIRGIRVHPRLMSSVGPGRGLAYPAMLAQLYQQFRRQWTKVAGCDVGLDVRQLAHAGDN